MAGSHTFLKPHVIEYGWKVGADGGGDEPGGLEHSGKHRFCAMGWDLMPIWSKSAFSVFLNLWVLITQEVEPVPSGSPQHSQGNPYNLPVVYKLCSMEYQDSVSMFLAAPWWGRGEALSR